MDSGQGSDAEVVLTLLSLRPKQRRKLEEAQATQSSEKLERIGESAHTVIKCKSHLKEAKEPFQTMRAIAIRRRSAEEERSLS